MEALRLYKKGDNVRQVILVNERRIRLPFVMEVLQDHIPAVGEFLLLCSWVDNYGNRHERPFPPAELELV
jgi:hypothetical protein